MNNKIEITVAGLSNSGKSTIAQIIQEALAAHGITSASIDPDYDPDFKFTPEQLAARVAEIQKKNVKVVINQHQLVREKE